ncbi:MAG: flagellar motor protein MotB [Bacteroidota bacterium]|nr:flagellar motor protein MotB [Bacteroidota bacterium]
MKQSFLFLLSIVFLGACVSSKKHKALMSEFDNLKMSLDKCNENLAKCEEEKNTISGDFNTKLNNVASELSTKDGRIKTLEEQMDYLKRTNTNLLDRLSDFSIVSKTGAENIKKSLQTIDEKDKYIKDLTNSMARKDSLNLSLVMNLKRSLGDVNSEDVNIEVRRGVVFISLSDKMLFRTASANINDKAAGVLQNIAKVLNDHSELEILVEGHTDNVPMANDCISDNWDLSTKRATAVVRTLQKRFKVDPKRMTAGGRAEYSPKSGNDSNDGRKLNRRTEIIILPKLDQFFDLVAPPK